MVCNFIGPLPLIHTKNTISQLLGAAGIFPNNSRYPLLVYKGAFSGDQGEGSDLLRKNSWTRCVRVRVRATSKVVHNTENTGPMIQSSVHYEMTVFSIRPWVFGVYTFHHYHTTAWEALLCISGNADIQVSAPSASRRGFRPRSYGIG